MTENAYRTEWTDQDFDSLSWHDNHIHAIRIRNPHEGYDCDLILDIDHIVEWIELPHKQLEFMVAPAILTFSNVTKLSVNFELAYKEDFEIYWIYRQEISDEALLRLGGHNYRWNIKLQPIEWKQNTMSFESHGFTQKLTKAPVRRPLPKLEDDEREP